MELIRVNNFSFSYNGSNKLVLKDINMKISKGDFVLICGESGCGKTTLLSHFKEELKPYGASKGEIVNRCKVGFVMQNPENQIVTDKVWSELAFGLENMGMKREEIKLRCGEIASFFGINEWYHKRTDELSGGQKQLLNLAGVLAMKPDVIVLDEPLSQLDPLAGRELMNAVGRINRELGIGIVMSEHNLSLAMTLAKKIVVMDRGSILIESKPNKIMDYLKEKKHIMQLAMPSGMRIYSALGGNENFPLTVEECKNWLEGFTSEGLSVNVEEKNFGDIAIKGKELFFGYEKNKDIIRNFSIEIKKGEVFAIVGGNGVGKTTALRLLSGLSKAYYGKLEVMGRVALLPQNPITLFTERSICLDFRLTGARDNEINEICDKLGINELLDRNPNDLSGGELQRCALCKVLLRKPEILLLDEPTKGIDAFMKRDLGKIIRGLGITVVMVSHDVEFCAEFADSCGMFFDGQLVNCCECHKFFEDNFFYTTEARRIAENVVDNAITTEEVISAFKGKEEINKNNAVEVFSAEGLVNKRENAIKETLSKRVIVSAVIILLCIPLVIWGGMRFFDDRKYFVVSLLIIVLTMMPFFMIFESRRARAREIVLVAGLCVICVGGRVVFAPFPQIKPICALIIISGLCLGAESGFIIGALSGFCSNFYFGQGPWTPWQMFAMGIIGFLAGIMRGVLVKKDNEPYKIRVAVFGFLSVFVVYGCIMNTASVFMYEPQPTVGQILTAWGMGAVYDCVHGVSTVVFLLIFCKGMCEKIKRVCEKFGLLRITKGQY